MPEGADRGARCRRDRRMSVRKGNMVAALLTASSQSVRGGETLKATGAAIRARGLSPPAYPGSFRRFYDADDPARMFLGTDITRISRSWRKCVTMFTAELP